MVFKEKRICAVYKYIQAVSSNLMSCERHPEALIRCVQ